MATFNHIYLWYVIVLVSGIIAAIASRISETFKVIVLVIIVSVIGFTIRAHQLQESFVTLLISLVLFFCTAIATNYLLYLRKK